MKRLFLVLLLVPGAAMAFNPERPTVAVLQPPAYDASESMIANAIAKSLVDELRGRGIDAFEAGATLERARMGDAVRADYYVEIAGSSSDGSTVAAAGVWSRPAVVTLDVLFARVAAEVRVYRGQSLRLIGGELLSRRRVAVVPASIGAFGRIAAAAVALPTWRWAYRSAARATAREAAAVVGAIIGE